jgi:PAS domain-containing protein
MCSGTAERRSARRAATALARSAVRGLRLFGGEPELSSSEWQVRRKDGSPLWVIVSLALADGEVVGRTLAIGHVQDISARKRAEDELRHSRERLAEAERVAQMGSWEWDITTDQSTWSEGLLHMYGLGHDELDVSRSAWRQRVYPDDRELIDRTTERALAERSSFTLEYRIIRADGRVRTLHGRGDVVVDDSGQPDPACWHCAGHHRDQARPRSAPRRVGRPPAARHRAPRVGGAHGDWARGRTSRTPHCAAGGDPPTDRRRSHQRGDRGTTRDHRGHRQMARQANPEKDRLIQPRRSYRPLPTRTRPAAQSKSGTAHPASTIRSRRCRGLNPPQSDSPVCNNSSQAQRPAARR